MSDAEKTNPSAAAASMRQRVDKWKDGAHELPADKVRSVADRLYMWACERGPWATENGEGDTVSVHRSDLITVLGRGVWPGDRESCIIVPDHHHLTTTSACEGDPETALLGHVAAALNNDMGPEVTSEGRARILRYLLDRETNQMKDTETP